jgi:transposase-like protein
VAASTRQRQIAADALRAGHTQAEACRRADLKSVSTLKRWRKDPAFQALLTGSPDIRSGSPPRLGAQRAAPESEGNPRARIWLAADGAVLGSHLGGKRPQRHRRKNGLLSRFSGSSL